MQKKTVLEVLQFARDNIGLPNDVLLHVDKLEYNGLVVFNGVSPENGLSVGGSQFTYDNTFIFVDDDGQINIELDYGLDEYYMDPCYELDKDDYFNFNVQHQIQISYEECLEIIDFLKERHKNKRGVVVKYGRINYEVQY